MFHCIGKIMQFLFHCIGKITLFLYHCIGNWVCFLFTPHLTHILMLLWDQGERRDGPADSRKGY